MHVDFRKLAPAALDKYCEAFRIPTQGLSLHEIAQVAQHHFESLEMNEDEILVSFEEYVLVYNGGNTVTDIRQTRANQSKRARKRARKVAGESSGGEEEVNPVFCTCRQPSYGEMIACDNKECEIEWFHMGCVTVKEGQKLWYCANCTKKMEAAKTASSSQDGGKRQKKIVKKE